MLPPRRVGEEEKKCVIIDLDETLVHSSFKVRTDLEREGGGREKRKRERERESESL